MKHEFELEDIIEESKIRILKAGAAHQPYLIGPKLPKLW